MSGWTFMTLMAAENDLTGYARADLKEMKKVGSGPGRHIVAEIDYPNAKTIRYYLTDKPESDDKVEEIANVNTGSPETLVEFVGWTLNHWQASRVALVLWNHGWGWDIPEMYHQTLKNRGQRENPTVTRSVSMEGSQLRRGFFSTSIQRIIEEQVTTRGIMGDDGSMDCLDNRELSDSLRQVVKLRQGKKIDLLGMDACLMNMVEVAYQIRNYVEVMVGSQEEEPQFGWPYDTVLTCLTDPAGISTEDFAKEIVERYIASYRKLPVFGVTQSAVRTSGMDGLVSAIDRLAQKLIDAVRTPQGKQKVLSARFSATHFRGKFGANYIDLVHFCRLLAGVGLGRGIDQAVPPVIKATQACLVANQSLGDKVAHAAGLSIYFPLNLAPSPYYDGLDFARDCSWSKFIKRFHS